MSFQVIPAGTPVLPEEWQRAMAAPVSELPVLDERQKAEVKRRSLNEEQYQRLKILMRRFAEEREIEQATKFGEFVQAILDPIDPLYGVSSVSRRGVPLGWRVTVSYDGRDFFEFQSHFDVVETLVSDCATPDELRTFRSNVVNGVLEAAGQGIAS